jgi:hypothetical protein
MIEGVPRAIIYWGLFMAVVIAVLIYVWVWR